MTRIQLEPAFVLHHRPYSETSSLVDAFSSGHGRETLLAKGVRGARSRLRGILQPFQPLLLSWTRRRELGLLTGADYDGYYPRLTGRVLFSGLYLNELLLRLVPRHDPVPQLFASYGWAIRMLSNQCPEEPILRIFEKRLLDAIGYGLTLDRDVCSGADIDPQAMYCYQLHRGPMGCEASRKNSVQVRGKTLLALANEQIADPSVLKEAKRLMRFILAAQVGDKPLASRMLFAGC